MASRCAFAEGDELPGDDELVPDPDDVERVLVDELARSSMFASHFRENASRALLLPRRRPGQRTPLWAQRLRAQQLMGVALRAPHVSDHARDLSRAACATCSTCQPWSS